MIKAGNAPMNEAKSSPEVINAALINANKSLARFNFEIWINNNGIVGVASLSNQRYYDIGMAKSNPKDIWIQAYTATIADKDIENITNELNRTSAAFVIIKDFVNSHY